VEAPLVKEAEKQSKEIIKNEAEKTFTISKVKDKSDIHI
jgi:hypothetical protein